MDGGLRADVILWLATDDFETVCALADVHVEDMRREIMNLFTLPPLLARKYGRILRTRVTGIYATGPE